MPHQEGREAVYRNRLAGGPDAKKKFRTLVEHFFGRFFDRDSLSPDADEHANVVQIIAMLALPGAIVSLFLLVDHPLVRSEVTRLWLRAGDRYVFVCYSMVVMGFVMTFKWDSLFPDRRDYLILTPLPISLRQFFLLSMNLARTNPPLTPPRRGTGGRRLLPSREGSGWVHGSP